MKKGLILILLMFVACVALAEDLRDKTITLDVKDMEITDVLRMIADQSGLNIITSKNVKGVVTINLQSIPVEQAIDAILKVNNCGYLKEENIIQVYTAPELSQKEQFSQLITRVYQLNYIRALDLKPMLLSLKSGRGRIEVEPKTNTIVVTDLQESIRDIEEAIKQMDKKLATKAYRLNYAKPADLQKTLQSIIPATEGDVLIDERSNSLVVSASPLLMDKIDVLISNWDKQIPQVLIEAKIMQINLDQGKLLGVEYWQVEKTSKHSMTVGSKSDSIFSNVAYADAFKIAVMSNNQYELIIQALESSSDVNLISSPRIVTLDNVEAKLLIGSSEPYEIFHYDAEGHITGKELKFVDVGIKLTVTPKISEDGFITMNIRPEVSSPRKGTVTDALAIDTTEANTVMTVKDGNTVVLGGLIKDEKEQRHVKVPFFGDIPILKYLFRTTYMASMKKEIIIFITPTIIKPGNVANYDKRAQEMENSFKEKKDQK